MKIMLDNELSMNGARDLQKKPRVPTTTVAIPSRIYQLSANLEHPGSIFKTYEDPRPPQTSSCPAHERNAVCKQTRESTCHGSTSPEQTHSELEHMSWVEHSQTVQESAYEMFPDNSVSEHTIEQHQERTQPLLALEGLEELQAADN